MSIEEKKGDLDLPENQVQKAVVDIVQVGQVLVHAQQLVAGHLGLDGICYLCLVVQGKLIRTAMGDEGGQGAEMGQVVPVQFLGEEVANAIAADGQGDGRCR